MANTMIAPNLGTILHEADVTLELHECAPKVQCIPTPCPQESFHARLPGMRRLSDRSSDAQPPIPGHR